MFKKQVKLVGIPVLGIASSYAALQVVACASVGASEKNKYKIGNHSFSSKNDMLDYIKSRTTIGIVEGKSSVSHWKLDGVDRVFDSPKDIDSYISEHNIQEVVANISLDGDSRNNLTNDYFSSIPANSVIPLKTNSNGEIINPNEGSAIAFKGFNNHVYFIRASEPAAQIEAMKLIAKNSWIQFHTAYNFNGIYFRNSEDLEYYLRNVMYQNSTTSHDFGVIKNQQLHLPVSTTHIGTEDKVNYASFAIPKNNDNTINVASLTNLLTEQIKNYSQQALSIPNNTGSGERVISHNELDQHIELAKYVNYWNVGAQDQQSYYVVDSAKNSRGNLYGNYFLKSPHDIGGISELSGARSGIMAITGKGKQWTKTSAPSPTELQQSSDMDADLMGSTISESIAIYVDKDISTDKNVQKNDVGIYDILEKDGLEHDFTDFLNRMSQGSNLKYRNLGTNLKEIDQTLLSGKKYNAFFELPILRGWIISRALEDGVSQVDLNRANQYFVDLSKKISNLINKDMSAFIVNNNELNLNQIYGFANHHNSLYVDPRTTLNNIPSIVKDELRVAQATKSYVTDYLTYRPIHEMTKVVDDFKSWSNSNYLTPKLIDKINFDAGSYRNRPELNFTKLLSTDNNKNNDLTNKLQGRFEAFKSLFLSQTKVNEENSIIDSFNDNLEHNNYDVRANGILLKRFMAAVTRQEEITSPVPNSPISPSDITNFLNSSVIYKTTKNVFRENNSEPTIADGLDSLGHIVKSTTDISAKIHDTFKKFKKLEKILKFAPYLDIAFTAVDIISSVVDFFTPKVKQEFYSYSNPDGHKYYWDGGEHVSQFMGLISETTHGIDELELLPPIMVTVPHIPIESGTNSTILDQGTASNLYFDGKFYDDSLSIWGDVISLLKQNAFTEPSTKAIFDPRVKVKNMFFNKNNIWSDASSLTGVVDNIKTSILNPYGTLKLSSDYLQDIYSTPSGEHTTDKNVAVDEYVKNLMGEIKPVYIFQKPVIRNNQITQLPFRLPFPYYSLTTNSVLNRNSNETDVMLSIQYVYDANIKTGTGSEFQGLSANVESSPNKIIENNLHMINQSFNIPSKIVSYSSALNTNHYSELNEQIDTVKIYVAHSPMGQVKYFLHLSAALAWERNQYNTRLSIVGGRVNKYIYHSEIDNKDHEFPNLTAQISWIMEHEINRSGADK